MIIYYVEDEVALANLINKYLLNEGYQTRVFHNGEEAIKHAGDPVDLWILDIMLPGKVQGFDLLKDIKRLNPNTAVIFTSARDKDIDKVQGLELGSDDYLAKPFSPRELLLRIKAILRHSKGDYGREIKYGDYIIETKKREITKNGVNIQLTNKEYELLFFFLNNRGNKFDRQTILKRVWGDSYKGSTRVVDDLLRRLRQKMPDLRIETIYGYGYRLL